ncbi:DUF4129 domain-containing protein [Haloarchaeobius iranensis]|uniref:Protein-glutamine gamma-glutamyltransferase-like C-terminal domain-containing protein n=1 Tax=Haloarchaeobius iranensis TaxID=996166 RepID=A0A1H0AE15_9EURY|nr:DUF4129 domain-containing protein [Haloarchaeobius iranensis]SDN31715.1 protein of unknown function [Haloarchaeobius iranensis]
MTAPARALALCVLLLAVPVVGVVGADGPISDATAAASSTPLTPLQEGPDDDTGNNTTVQHRDPDTVGEDGDLGAIKSWLSGRMAASLRDSSVQISQGQYERGRSLVGDEYDGLLAQYVDVAGETDAQVDDETADTLTETRETQRAFAETAEAYEETYEEYQTAKANGNEARARELARELDTLAERLRGQNRNLTDNYRRLGNQTGQDFSGTIQRFDGVTGNTTSQAAEIRGAELVRTTLVVRPNRTRTSFTRPVELRGELRVAGNETLPSEVQFTVAGTSRTVAVGPNGSVSLPYRPVTVPVGDTRLNVTYVPESTSLYLGSNASVDVTVLAESPTVTLSDRSQEAGFGDEVRVAGQVSVNGTPVGGGPVDLLVDGRRLASTRTAPDGSFVTTAALPASVPTGEVDVVVRAGQPDQAIERNATTTTLSVTETPTDLRVEASGSDDALSVSGQLTTAGGVSLPDQQVRVYVGGEFVTTARTSAAGDFATTIDRPAVTDGVAVQVLFDGRGTNLANSSARTRADLATGGDGSGAEAGGSGSGGDGGSSGPATGLFGVPLGTLVPLLGGAVLLLGAGVVVLRNRRRGSTATGDATPTETATGSSDDGEIPSVADRIESARDQSAASLVRASYGTLRDVVSTLGDLSENATHWEFYRAVVDEFPSVADDLQQVVEVYEHAAFAEEPVDESSAATAYKAAVRVAKTIQSGPASDPGDD